jgi:hypothetical protein
MDLVSRLKDFYGFSSGFFGKPERKEHFDLTAIFGQSSQMLPQEMDVEALINPLGIGSGTDTSMTRWIHRDATSMAVHTPLGFMAAVDSALVRMEREASALADPTQATVVEQARRELTRFQADSRLGGFF